MIRILMSPVSPALEEERGSDVDETPDAEPEDADEGNSSSKSLDEIIDAYAGSATHP